jgi:signal transduction histidine kinase/ligand-binding sensor domain-containing protein/CheY-like chemotaxis protein
MIEKTYKYNHLRIICLTFLLIPFLSHSQQNNIRFKRLTSDQGLSQNWIRCIIQDKDGFMWFGTGGNGINKYDGYDFKVYKNDPNDTNSITSNWVNTLYVDKKSRLWIGTQHGLNIYNEETDKFIRFPFFQSEIIVGIHESVDGKSYIVTGGNIFEVDADLKTIKPFCQNYEGCYGNIFRYSLIDGNRLWVASLNGLFLFDLTKKTHKNFRHEENNPKSLSDDVLQTIYKDNKGRIWIGTIKKGLSLISCPNKESDQLCFINFIHNAQDANSISDGGIWAILDDGNDNLWIGKENGSMDILDLKDFEISNAVFRHFEYNPFDETSLSNNSVNAFCKDNQGTVWVGTYSGGINYYNKRLFKFDHIKHVLNENPNENITINNNTINVFMEDGDDLWIGSEKGINILNRKTGKYQQLTYDPRNPRSIGSNAVSAIFKDSRNDIWVGTWAGGLNLYNRQTRSFTRFLQDNNNPNSISCNNIFGIAEDKDGFLWLATMSGGLNKYDRKTGKFTAFHFRVGDNKSITGDWVQTILESSANELWIGTSDGVDIFDKKTGTSTNFKNDSANKKSICYNGANIIFEDSKYNIWIGTDGGLNLFVRKDSSFIYYREQDGLPNNSIKSICEDNNGNIWVSTNFGISKFVDAVNLPAKPVFKNYTKNDGLQSNEFSRRAALKTSDGKIYFGGINGYNVFHPDSLKDNPHSPNIVFTDFLLYNKPVEIGTKDSPLKQHIGVAKEIVLSYFQSVFSIKFAALNFISPQNNQYAYMLEGFEKDWNYVGNKREITYTNLNPGEYVFKVKASNNDGVWNETGVSIKIIVLPPWWKALWFRILIYSFLAFLVALFMSFRLKFYRKQNVKLSAMVKERTKELEEVNVYLEEKQEEINNQNEELMSQRDALEEANNKLEKQKIQILEQNKELDLHRNELENLVEERTHQLIVAKEKAEESDRLKTSFLANLSHEIRTPLNAIVGFSTMALEETFTDEEKAEHKQIIQKSSDSLLALISDIIDFSKIESGNIDIVFRDVPMSHIIARIGDVFKIQLNRQQMGIVHDLALKLDFPDELQNSSLETDEMRLLQVLSHLIHNAIKFTGKGEVQIGCHLCEEGKMAEFYVRDNGIGIRKEHQEIIFERFRKIENDKSMLHRGSGIGLSISQHLVRMLGGHIRVESEPSVGTTFYFTIPVKKNLSSSVSQKSNVNMQNDTVDFKKALVLVAEDDLANYIIIEKFLQKHNITVIRAVNGIHAVNMALSDSDIQLILMDIKMPEMDGVEALHQIREKGITIPVVAQTAYALAHEVVKLKQEGFDDYITKPLDFAEILKILRRYLKS